MPAYHFHSVAKNKCYFVQTSYYIPANNNDCVLDQTRSSDRPGVSAEIFC